MGNFDQSFLRKLALMLVIKFAVLLALWWFFVREQIVKVDDIGVVEQIFQPVPPRTQGQNK